MRGGKKQEGRLHSGALNFLFLFAVTSGQDTKPPGLAHQSGLGRPSNLTHLCSVPHDQGTL